MHKDAKQYLDTHLSAGAGYASDNHKEGCPSSKWSDFVDSVKAVNLLPHADNYNLCFFRSRKQDFLIVRR